MKTFTVIGLGRFGTSVATQLFNMGYETTWSEKLGLCNRVYRR